ncbi:MAG TPA: acyl-ACP--UDP-N-acetylglucosamine O-acyltransferase [Chlamydiales bacterium]|nr:acyl-ACP--UDP-N-acetylglucosamine O-acyltransferase [Chlamydiales bacterium]
MDSNHHVTAIIDSGATIGKNVTIGPYAIIGPHVHLEDNVVIHSHAVIDGWTTIGAGSTIYPGAVIGTKTQDKKFKGEKTFVVIGKNTEIRECVTINSSCQEGTTVKVGDNCLIMAYCHVAHNCEVGNEVIMSNSTMLAGHVIVEDCVILSGLVGVHQFCRIGAYAMVGGMSRITHDVPPYTIGAGTPYRLGGLNLVGMRRRGFHLETTKELAKAWKLIYRSGLSLDEAYQAIEEQVAPLQEVRHFIQFCKNSKRGIIPIDAGLEEWSAMKEEVREPVLVRT